MPGAEFSCLTGWATQVTLSEALSVRLSPPFLQGFPGDACVVSGLVSHCCSLHPSGDTALPWLPVPLLLWGIFLHVVVFLPHGLLCPVTFAGAASSPQCPRVAGHQGYVCEGPHNESFGLCGPFCPAVATLLGHHSTKALGITYI